MKNIIVTLLLSFAFAVADSTVVVSDSTQKNDTLKASVVDSPLNTSVQFANLTLDQTYSKEILLKWESVTIPVESKKLFMAKEMEPVNATETYGRILLKCGSIYPFKKLIQEPVIDSIKGLCFEITGALFQQFEDNAGIYQSEGYFYYLSTNSVPHEAVSGWAFADSVFSYRTAMGEEKHLIHFREHLLFSE
jgi:hypothetical protein